MDYYSAYHDELQKGGARGGGIPRVFVGSPYQRGHGIGSFLGGLFRRVLPYLGIAARAVGKEALRAGANIIEDVENNTPIKVATRHRFEESRDKLKRQAKEKITSLMKGSGYKADAKMHVAHFPFAGHDKRIVKRRRASKRSSSKIKTRKKKKKNTKSTKNKRTRKTRATVKRLKTSTKRRKIGKKRTVSDIFS